MARGLFVTATDTGAGKTRFCSLLVRALRSRGLDAVGFKPFCCGDREDALRLQEASDGSVDLALVNPVWLRVPAAPMAAAMVENRLPDIATALEAFRSLSQDRGFVVVEGVGGWRVPIARDYCLSDFARELGLPVLVVAANRLGALNHTQLTVDAVRACGAQCAGVVLNHPCPQEPDPAQVTNAGLLELLLPVPVLGVLEHENEPHGALSDGIVRALQRANVVPAFPSMSTDPRG